MNAYNQPTQADVSVLLAKVAEQDLRVRELQVELEQFAQVIEEFQQSRATRQESWRLFGPFQEVALDGAQIRPSARRDCP